jgi:serine phosphatase RsbU (regulator of sigma subunit)
LRLAQSITARNALGRDEKEDAQEIATMLYGEVRPFGHFRFVNFGHPPPLVFSLEYGKFMEIDNRGMVQFLPLGLQIPEDDPDRNRYYSLESRQRRASPSDVAELTLMSPGDILFLYTDGVYDGSDMEERQQLQIVMHEYCLRSAKDMCNALLEYAVKRDARLRQIGENDRIDDKTVFIIRRN